MVERSFSLLKFHFNVNVNDGFDVNDGFGVNDGFDGLPIKEKSSLDQFAV